ncbi:F-box/kelch-repeat protein SKIP11-like [Zingiber officinale]|uniref:F-box domain-containing protein n=1 Tax=Zingiber officinale TaxID=94328 RepID=A0A8J5GI35_ZINOF|nr:F-box/kelch-repeat protein SKIP11-like [Zingiber officinale]KAG6506937.1 hypothetical protein ZIOFF_032270 [Zingiber officinale]
MLEDLPCLISRVFESSSDQESNWHYLAYPFHDSSNSKKRQKLDEEMATEEEDQSKRKKLSHRLEAYDDDDPSAFNRLTRDLILSCLLLLSRSDYGAVASVSRAFRSMIRDAYEHRRRQGIAEHWVYFSCTALQWHAFDPYRRRWITVPPMPASPTETFAFSDKESLAVGTDLLVFGREMTSYVVMRYSILSNSWCPGVVMNSPRCLFGSASRGGKAIVAGGTNGREILNSAELYDSETQTWESLPAMNRARKLCSGVFMDEKFYVIGGMANEREVLTCGEEYDMKRSSWRLIPNMSDGLIGENGAPPLVAVVSNQLYAARYADKMVVKYNKRNNAWETLGKLPERSYSMNGWGIAFRGCGQRLLVIGGHRGLRGGMIELNSWVPNGGPPEWNTIAVMQSGDFVFNCAVMGC